MTDVGSIAIIGAGIAALVASHEKVNIQRLADPTVALDELEALLLPAATVVG